MTIFDDPLTSVVAGTERFSGAGFVWNQGVVGRCGGETKGY
jgi:hypothetical protein